MMRLRTVELAALVLLAIGAFIAMSVNNTHQDQCCERIPVAQGH
jgi:hypothetical protein